MIAYTSKEILLKTRNGVDFRCSKKSLSKALNNHCHKEMLWINFLVFKNVVF